MDGGSRRAVVAGAGIAGLATALRLHRSGWEVLVLERAPARRSAGYLVNMIGTGYDAAARLDLLPELAELDIGFFTSTVVRADGRTVVTVPAELARAALGTRAVTVFRGDLETVLYERVRAHVEVRFSSTVRDVEKDADEVRVQLSDGRTERADLLVGADGLHSGVRAAVFGPEERFRVAPRHLVGAFGLPAPPRDVPPGTGTTFIGPRRSAAVINLGERGASAFFTHRSDDPAADLARGAADTLGSVFGDLGGGAAEALRQLRADPSGAYFDTVSQVVMDEWHRGRVVLVGDAAWCVTLFAGYGAALALTGAETLGAELRARPDDIPGALAAWDAGLRDEVRKRQALARKGMAQYAPPSMAHVRLREMAIRAFRLPGVAALTRRAIERHARQHRHSTRA